MTVQAFLKLVEIRTKVASVFPFLIGTLYAVYRFGRLDPVNLVLMFFSMLCFDMTTTAVNNYMDYKNASVREGYGYLEHNAIPRYGLSPFAAKTVTAVLLAVASVLGIILFCRTDLLVLAAGALCFTLGIAYSSGPLPLSHTPFGEAASGLAMGFMIPFLSVYVHVWDMDLFYLRIEKVRLFAGADLYELGLLFLVAMPAVAGIANIMLANNICDREDDRANGRKTLVHHIGLRPALAVFAALYALGFTGLAAAVVLGAAPPVYAAALAAAVPVFINVRKFFAQQRKDRTFVLAVHNFVLTSALQAVTLAAGLIMK